MKWKRGAQEGALRAKCRTQLALFKGKHECKSVAKRYIVANTNPRIPACIMFIVPSTEVTSIDGNTWLATETKPELAQTETK